MIKVLQYLWQVFGVILYSGLHRKHKCLKYIIDVTIGYMNGRPLEAVKHLIPADFDPCQTVIHYRKYPAATVPHSESLLTQWFYERFAEKDRLLDHFYSTGKFPVESSDGTEMEEDAKCHRLHPVSFSPERCLLIHAFYIVSTSLHVYLTIYIFSAIWFWFD